MLGLLALSSLIVEGAAANWSGVYLRDNLDAPRGYAAAGFAGILAGHGRRPDRR